MGAILYDLQRHIQTLSLETGARIKRVPLLESRVICRGYETELRIPTVASTISYAVALHEIGHLAIKPHIPLFQSPLSRVSAEEQAAWKWAYQQALVWTPAMRQTGCFSLGTYGLDVSAFVSLPLKDI